MRELNSESCIKRGQLFFQFFVFIVLNSLPFEVDPWGLLGRPQVSRGPSSVVPLCVHLALSFLCVVSLDSQQFTGFEIIEPLGQ